MRAACCLSLSEQRQAAALAGACAAVEAPARRHVGLPTHNGSGVARTIATVCCKLVFIQVFVTFRSCLGATEVPFRILVPNYVPVSP
eukprot:364944-Chlamydomonas_euryale.AAC.12